MTARAILADAWRLYRLLLRRSILVAGCVFSLIAALEYASVVDHWLSTPRWPLRPWTKPVLAAVLISSAITALPANLTFFLAPLRRTQWILGSLVWSSLTAPFSAHVLTVVYYRLVDPERPVIHEEVGRWRSVWAGA